MKKSLVGVFVLWFLLILAGVTVSFYDSQKIASCENLANLLPVDEFNGIATQKSYALRFPVL